MDFGICITIIVGVNERLNGINTKDSSRRNTFYCSNFYSYTSHSITKEITESFDTSNIEQDNLDTVIVTGFNSIRTTLKIFPAVVQIFRYYASVLGIPTIILSIGVFILLFTISLSILLTILGRRDD